MNVFGTKKAQADGAWGGFREHQPGFLVESTRSTQGGPLQEPGPRVLVSILSFPASRLYVLRIDRAPWPPNLTRASDPPSPVRVQYSPSKQN